MKKLYYILAALGFIAVVLSAMASNAGAELCWMLPAGLIGCGMMYIGAYQARRIEDHEKWTSHRISSGRNYMRRYIK